MAKYNYEFKKKVVDAYNNGEAGYKFLCEKYTILIAHIEEPFIQIKAGAIR